MIGKKSALVLSKILRLSVNTMTADDKSSLLNRDNLTQHIRVILSQKQKSFSEFFSAFLRSILDFEHYQKNMTLTTDVFLKLRTPNKVLR